MSASPGLTMAENVFQNILCDIFSSTGLQWKRAVPYAWFMVVLCLLSVGGSHGLVCWHCIADNCDINPKENYRAEQKSCLEGQTCQKVFFEMESDIDDNKYRSTVRSCADECIPHNDFVNCSSDLRTTRGCVKRVCCSDDDLCNNGDTVNPQPRTILFCHWFLLVIFVVFRLCHLV